MFRYSPSIREMIDIVNHSYLKYFQNVIFKTFTSFALTKAIRYWNINYNIIFRYSLIILELIYSIKSSLFQTLSKIFSSLQNDFKG